MEPKFKHALAEIAHHLPHAPWWFVWRCHLLHRRLHTWSEDTDAETGISVAVRFCPKCNFVADVVTRDDTEAGNDRG